MSINKLVKFCDSKYIERKQQCLDCPNRKQGECSSCNCSKCFQEMFFSSGRTFNCVSSTYSYVCRYIYQYSSELQYLLNIYSSLFVDENGNQKLDKINIISIGCGPCSEAFALENFLKDINFTGDVSFCGYDLNKHWETIHSQVSSLLPFKMNFYYQDCFEHISNVDNYQYPNVLILNYVLSDIAKNGDLQKFIESITSELVDKMPSKSIIIINDINHYNPRDAYEKFIRSMIQTNNIGYDSFSFIGYQYGKRYKYNNIFFSLGEKALLYLQKKYETKTNCSSAQLIVYKKSNKTIQ